MPDKGHELTEKRLRDLEKELKGEYEIAAREVAEKYEKYMAKFADDLKQQKALMDAGKITQKEYNDFVYRKTMTGKRWQEMRDTLAADYHNANEIALKQARGGMADVYALNANYATYQIEHDGKINTGFTLYNHDTAEYLIGDERQLMPGPSTKKAAEIAANKDMQWNRQKIQSAVLQGVLQGESPYQVADRLMQVGQMNYNSAVRYSRTMTTSAQNAGRYEAYKRAEKVGVKLTIEWQATLDGRTRHDHRMMHGQRRDVGEPFVTPDGYEILYPADCSGESDAPQKEIWNCRCTLLSWVKGFDGDTVKSSPKMGDMTFEEWQNEKATKNEATQKPKNRFNQTITFSDKLSSEKWDDAKELITELSSEYDTKLQVVEPGAKKGAGEVQISGSVMRLSSNSRQTIVHEFAHTISMENQTKFGLYDEKEFWKEIKKIRREYINDVKDDTTRWISSYEHSSKGYDEFMAEAFTQAKLSDSPSPYALKVLKVIDKYFKKA